MYGQQIAIIRQAIEQKRVLSFRYNQKPRLVEPHILGYDKDRDLTLSAYMLPEKGLENWRSFHVSKLSGLAITEQSFQQPRRGYNRNDDAFREVIARL